MAVMNRKPFDPPEATDEMHPRRAVCELGLALHMGLSFCRIWTFHFLFLLVSLSSHQKGVPSNKETNPFTETCMERDKTIFPPWRSLV